MKEKLQFKGKDIENCSREELLQVIEYIQDPIRLLHRFQESDTIRQLRLELEIKNDVISRLSGHKQ